MDPVFVMNSLLLGVGLAMDAFSVALANGLHDPCAKRKKILAIGATFGFFQALMPLLGWLCVHTMVELFQSLTPWIPWVALALLTFIGGKMLWEALKNPQEACPVEEVLGVGALLLQGLATSIDALSVGFTISQYDLSAALTAAGIIGGVTFALCCVGVWLGKRVGTRLAGGAGVLGGVILIAIGLEIFIKGLVG